MLVKTSTPYCNRKTRFANSTQVAANGSDTTIFLIMSCEKQYCFALFSSSTMIASIFNVFAVYLHHETTQCFVKQSRDFVVLAAERVEVSLQWCLTRGWVHSYRTLMPPDRIGFLRFSSLLVLCC